MENIFDYIEDNGNYLFEEKEFNSIDALILSTISYVEFNGIIENKRNYISLSDALEKFISDCDYKGFVSRGFVNKEVFKLARYLINKKRYKDIKCYYYVHNVTNDSQFSAITMKLNDGTIFVGFEGTDHNLVGWEEDFALSYTFPVPAHKDAIKYLNKVVSIFDKKVIVAGHSKGGHLAIVSSMYSNFLIRSKIKAIYNFDGPGLREEQIDTKKYRNIENKILHIVPNCSIFGLLLNHGENYYVVKSKSKDIYAHSVFTWFIQDSDFVYTELSEFSKKLEYSIKLWLEEHDDIEREKMVKEIFKLLKSLEINNFFEIFKMKNIFTLIKNSRTMDEGTKEMLKNFVVFNIDYMFDN